MRVKICGITRQEDAELAIELGADALGFVFEPTSPRFVGGTAAATIPSRLGPFVATVAVYGRYLANPMDSFCSLIQLSDGATERRPHIRVFRFPPGWTTSEAINAMDVPIAEHVPRAVVIDSFHTELAGGTGVRADWELASQVARYFESRKVVLAGGLTPDDVAGAIQKVKPYAVDVSSGVEVSPGIKDPIKMRDFIQAAKEAGANI